MAAADVFGIGETGDWVDRDGGEVDEAFVAEGVERAEDRVVVHPGGDGVRLLAGGHGGGFGTEIAVNRKIGSIGAIERENKMVRVFAVEEGVEAGAAAGNHAAGFLRLLIKSTAGGSVRRW